MGKPHRQRSAADDTPHDAATAEIGPTGEPTEPTCYAPASQKHPRKTSLLRGRPALALESQQNSRCCAGLKVLCPYRGDIPCRHK